MQYDVSLQTIAWFNELRQDGKLEISPKFQRRPVWLQKERVSLIGTVLQGWPFPEVYIQVDTDLESGKQKYIVVDGQQRITSLMMFIDGKISAPDAAPWNAQYFRDFDEPIKRAFWAYKVVVRLLQNTNDPEIREVFRLLNTNNFALNDQELRNAKYLGKFKLCAERLADNPFFQSIALFTPREVRRMEDVEFVSELLLRAVEGVTNKKDLLEDAYSRYDEDFPGEAEYEKDVGAAVTLIQSLVNDENKTAIRTKTNFYSIFGACLRYYRDKKRITFQHPDRVAAGVGELLLQVRNYQEGAGNAEVAEYFDSYARAASDKQRRVSRENILVNVIGRADVDQQAPAAAGAA